MMMERSKPAAAKVPASEQAAKPSSSAGVQVQSNSDTTNTTASVKNASSEERVRDLERRLDALDGAEKITSSVAPITSSIDVDTAAATATAITEPASTTEAATAASQASSAASAPPNPLLVRVCACV